ncbi:MAG: LysR family transcriptional regulator [Coriobacteriales bacterium]
MAKFKVRFLLKGMRLIVNLGFHHVEGELMRIEYLEEFLALVDARSFTDAAKRCHVSQSSLSKHISAMEAELGAELFRRPNNPVRLTREGWSFAHDARAIVGEYRGAVDRVEAIKHERDQSIVLGYYYPVARQAIDIIHKWTVRNKHDYEIKPVSLHPGQITAALQGKAVDAVVTIDPGDALDSICNSIVLKEERMLLAVNKKSPLARQDTVKLADLENETFLRPGPQIWPGVGDHLEEVLGSLPSYRNGRFFDDVETVLLGVYSNMGIAMVFDHNRSIHGGKIRFIHLEEEDATGFTAPLKLAWLRESEESYTKSKYIRYLKNMF